MTADDQTDDKTDDLGIREHLHIAALHLNKAQTKLRRRDDVPADTRGSYIGMIRGARELSEGTFRGLRKHLKVYDRNND